VALRSSSRYYIILRALCTALHLPSFVSYILPSLIFILVNCNYIKKMPRGDVQRDSPICQGEICTMKGMLPVSCSTSYLAGKHIPVRETILPVHEEDTQRLRDCWDERVSRGSVTSHYAGLRWKISRGSEIVHMRDKCTYHLTRVPYVYLCVRRY
jgi:hypothetical protein